MALYKNIIEIDISEFHALFNVFSLMISDCFAPIFTLA